METFKNKTALIADDDIDSLTELSQLLQNMGFSVVSAETQREAEDFINDTRPDIAIFDLMMDNRDSGFILGYKLKKKYPEVPVIILSAVTSDTGMMFGLDSDEERSWIKADCYLEKGLRKEQLEMEIFQLMNQ